MGWDGRRGRKEGYGMGEREQSDEAEKWRGGESDGVSRNLFLKMKNWRAL
jgi:hypothetical protein